MCASRTYIVDDVGLSSWVASRAGVSQSFAIFDVSATTTSLSWIIVSWILLGFDE